MVIHHNLRYIVEMQRCFNIHKSANVTYHTNRPKDRSHVIMSFDLEISFDKI